MIHFRINLYLQRIIAMLIDWMIKYGIKILYTGMDN